MKDSKDISKFTCLEIVWNAFTGTRYIKWSSVISLQVFCTLDPSFVSGSPKLCTPHILSAVNWKFFGFLYMRNWSSTFYFRATFLQPSLPWSQSGVHALNNLESTLDQGAFGVLIESSTIYSSVEIMHGVCFKNGIIMVNLHLKNTFR